MTVNSWPAAPTVASTRAPASTAARAAPDEPTIFAAVSVTLYATVGLAAWIVLACATVAAPSTTTAVTPDAFIVDALAARFAGVSFRVMCKSLSLPTRANKVFVSATFKITGSSVART